MAAPSTLLIARRALQVEQTAERPLYLFTLTASEILQVAEISRIRRTEEGELEGYQRKVSPAHVNEIVKYLNGPEVLFPNPIILALSSDVRFVGSRGPKTSDGFATSGTIEIPLVQPGRPKPGWIVDGQQRAIALSRAVNKNFPVPITAFIADEVAVQRDQFIRVNTTKPLPATLVTELLPEVTTSLPRKLAMRQLPSHICTLLNQDDRSPFQGLIQRASTDPKSKRSAVITDNSVIKMIEDSFRESGCLFPYRNVTTGETDTEAVWQALTVYWTAVRDTFPDAWGKSPAKSRLMHGAGIRAMGRLMDHVLGRVDPIDHDALNLIKDELALVAHECRWTGGHWDELNLEWDSIENTTKHIQGLSNFLVRTYKQSRIAKQ